MKIKKEVLKVGFQIENIKIIEKMNYYIYNNKEKISIFKCLNIDTKLEFLLREIDFLKETFKLVYNYKGRKTNYKNYEYILRENIGYIKPKKLIQIVYLNNSTISSKPYVLCDCLNCGKQNFLMRYADLKKAKAQNLDKSCGCMMKETKKKQGEESLKNSIKNGWKYIEESYITDNGVRFIKAQCECCGEIKIIDRNRILSTLCEKRLQEKKDLIQKNRENLIKSKKPEWVKDIIGMKKNELTITNFSFYIEDGKQSIQRFWLADCSCGQKICIRESDFLNSIIRSCGHLRSLAMKELAKYGKEYIGKKFHKLTVIDATIDERTHSSFFYCRCDCGKIIYTRAYDVVKGRHHSCGCELSIGEQKIIEFLNYNNVSFSTQKTFPDCKHISNLRFDFCIYNKEDENKFVLIEFNGKQHYSKSRFSSSDTEEILEKRLKENQIRDQIKRDYCATNNILLLEIPYWHRDKMFQMIKDFLIKNGIANEDEIDVNIQKIQEIQENIEDIDMANNIKITYTKYMDNTNRVFEKFKKEDIPLIEPVEQKTTHYDFKEYMDKKIKKSKESEPKEKISKRDIVVEDYTVFADNFCNHNPNDPNNTLQFSPVRKMTVPNKLTAFCKKCKQVFSFIEENGIIREE